MSRTPLAGGPAVIVANPASIFPRQLAADWRARGLDVRIIARRWDGPDSTPEGVPILASDGVGGAPPSGLCRLVGAVASCTVHLDKVLFRRRYAHAILPGHGLPSFSEPLVNALSIAPFVRSLRPSVVFGMEAFSYGPATAACRGVPRVLMPWGGDIFMSAEASPLCFGISRAALRAVDLVCPSSADAADHIVRRFGVDPARVAAMSWGVDRSLFRRAGTAARAAILAEVGWPKDTLVVTGIRRFHPWWGSDEVLEAFLHAAKEGPPDAARFVLLGGSGGRRHVAEARERIAREGLLDRFLLCDEDLPMDAYARLLSVTDIGVSLMRVRDMRSFSILQAASTGAALLLTDHPEYRRMARNGFAAWLVPAGDARATSEFLTGLLASETERGSQREANDQYLEAYERADERMEAIFRRIVGLAEMWRGGRG